MSAQWEFLTEPFDYATRLGILIVRVEDGVNHFVKPLEFETLPAGNFYDTATVTEALRGRRVTSDFLQAALDAAWKMGLRPAGFDDHTSELTAVRYHLEDMRTLAKLRPAQPAGGM